MATKGKVEIAFSDIPSWLRNSAFFETLDENDSEPISVPSMTAKDEPVNTVEDLINTLKVMEFWGARELPYSVMKFCYSNSTDYWFNAVAMAVEKETSELLWKYFSFIEPTNVKLEDVLCEGSRPELVNFWLSHLDLTSKHGGNAITQAARFGRLDLVQLLHERNFPWSGDAYLAAAQYGHLNVLEFLHNNSCPKFRTELIWAARGGQLECMKYLHSIGCEWDDYVTMEYAVSSHYCYVKNLTFEFEEMGEQSWTDDFSIIPPADGYIECLRYALNNGCPIHRTACSRTAEYGLIDCLQLLHAKHAHWDENTTEKAAEYNHFECLKYLHINGCPSSSRVAMYVASHGKLEQLQFIRDNSLPWEESATQATAQGGHLDCLRFAMEEGCPYDSHALLQAAAWSGNVDCLKYLIDDQLLDVEDGAFLIEAAFTLPSVACLQYLLEVGCPVHNYQFDEPHLSDTISNDTAFLKCIKIATKFGWQYNESLLYYIERPLCTHPRYTNPLLPLCLEYVRTEGWPGELNKKKAKH